MLFSRSSHRFEEQFRPDNGHHGPVSELCPEPAEALLHHDVRSPSQQIPVSQRDDAFRRQNGHQQAQLFHRGGVRGGFVRFLQGSDQSVFKQPGPYHTVRGLG